MTAHYIALEGVEGAGKSSLLEPVAADLAAAGHPTITVREPGGTAAGEGIRQVLLSPESVLAPWTEALLFAAQRAQLAGQVMGPALDAGTSVVGDRSVYSSLAYQGAGRELGVESVRMINEAGLGAVWPSRVVLLRVAAAAGLERQAVADRIGSEGVNFQHQVAAAYDRMADEDPDRFVVVDASQPSDIVQAEVVKELLARW